MTSETARIADQLRRAFTADPWHGPPLRDLLSGLTAEQAHARPLSSAHTIWELVLHIDLWAHIAFEATQGVPMPRLYGTEKDWPTLSDASSAAWTAATGHLFQTADRLAQAIETSPDSRLPETVPGRQYDFYYLFHGIVQHSLYHAGQIAMLKSAMAVKTPDARRVA